MEDALEELRTALGDDEAYALIIAFLDDVSIRAPYKVVCRILRVAKDIFAKYGLTLNPAKCVIFETLEAREHIDRLLAARASQGSPRPRYQLGPDGPGAQELAPTKEEGYVLLGTPVGSPAYVRAHLRKTIDELRPDAKALKLLAQTEGGLIKALTILRSCFAHKCRHLARTVPPDLMSEIGLEYDELIADTILAKDGILGEGEDSLDHLVDPTYLELSRQRIFRSVFKGGLSIRSTAIAARPAYTAGVLRALPLVADIASRSGVWRALLPLTPDASDDAITRLVLSTQCLQQALGTRQWLHWRDLARDAGHTVDAALAPTGQAHGAMAADPGSGRGQSPSSASLLTSLTPPQAVRAALSGTLPKKAQHVLTTLEEHGRDKRLEEALLQQATAQLPACKGLWSSSTPLSPALALLQLQGSSGPGNEWILDTSRRRDRAGLPRQGNPLYHKDAPLSNDAARTSLRANLLLPLGKLYKDAQEAAGTEDPPRCFCRARCDENRVRFLDAHGLHLMTRVIAAGYTHRHNEYVHALAALLRRAGFQVSIEKHPFRAPTDLADQLSEEGDGHAAARADLSKRLDLVVEAVPVTLLRRVDPSLVAHLGADVSTVRTLIDATFTHPGPYLESLKNTDSATLRDAEAMGDSEVRVKRDKYQAASIAAGYVLLPYHCNVYGRLHPVASKFLDAVVDLVVLKSQATGLPGNSLVDRTTSFKRALLRGVSLHMRYATVHGWMSATRVARPRFRLGTLAALPPARWGLVADHVSRTADSDIPLQTPPASGGLDNMPRV
jgi:hypothetical protein